MGFAFKVQGNLGVECDLWFIFAGCLCQPLCVGTAAL